MAPDVNDAEIIRRFQIRRQVTLCAIALCFLDAMILTLLCDPDCSALFHNHVVVGSLLIASPFVSLALVVLIYKCPKCGSAPFREALDDEGFTIMKQWGSPERFFIIMKQWSSPERCSICGIRMKWTTNETSQ